MYKRQTTVVNRSGIHARPASLFVQLAKSCTDSRITVANLDCSDSEPVSAKSIISVLSLGLSTGTRVEVAAEGKAEKEIVDAMIELIDSGFGE